VGKDKKEDKGGKDTKERVYYPATSAKYLIFRSISDKMAIVLLELAREMVFKYLKDQPSKDEK
jgi:hypothetical protein